MSIRLLSSCAFIVACVAGSSSWASSRQATQAQAAQSGGVRERMVIAAGCLMRQTPAVVAPTTGHESESADGLALTKATLVDAPPASGRTSTPSAVPGSRPAGAGSETIAQQQPSPNRPSSTEERAFWITGSHRAELTRYIGQHVQVTGTLREPPAAAERSERTTTGVGTTGTRSAETSSTARPGTRAESGEGRVAHPSAPTQTIEVATFRVDGGICP